MVLRRLNLLKYANYVLFAVRRVRRWPDNVRFLRTHPDFKPPPAWELFDVTGHVHYEGYYVSGVESAERVSELVGRYGPARSNLRVLEWGCGLARCLRHLPRALPGAVLTGTDYNEKSVRWCRDNVPGITFVPNGLTPPLPFADRSFDVVYALSVFTHLSEVNGRLWMDELKRVLAADGIIVFTTRGGNFMEFFTRDEARRFNLGGVVAVTNNVTEGKKNYLTHHSEAYVRSVLVPPLEVADHRRGAPNSPQQDYWVIRKPAPSR